MKILIAGLLWCLLIQPLTGQNQPPAFGAVQGVVLGAEDKPLSRAKVYAMIVRRARAGILNHVFTDDRGQFLLGGLVPGEHVMFASKEEEGYPDTGSKFLAMGRPQPPTIIVEPGKVTPSVVIRLGEPGGLLAGKILEAGSEEPIKTARYKLYPPDEPENFISTGPDEKGYFKMVVPSVPFKMEVTAPGYRTWQSESTILVPSKSKKDLSILLVREKTPK